MDTSTPAIVVKDLYKTFKLPHEQYSGIKQAALNIFNKNKGSEIQKVLSDISFEIKEGEFFGIVGRNGSGKSTLLKLLSGIYAPDKGLVQVNGSLTPFIELGVGFNPELTGRENVYMNGALLGFDHAQMDGMYDEIVEFAEIEKFMDQKLKNYSSGMQVRLAFSIAIRADTDILILDEVLAVGDEAFQKKCIDVFENYKSKKKTVILVTHDMATVKRFCSQAMLIDNGGIVDIGSPDKIANTYSKLNDNSISNSMSKDESARSKKNVTHVKLVSDNIVNYGELSKVKVNWTAYKGKVKNVGVAVYKNTGEYIFGTNTVVDKFDIKDAVSLEYEFQTQLGAGNYHLKIGLFGKSDKDIIEFIDEGPQFTVKKPLNQKWEGLIDLEHDWRIK